MEETVQRDPNDVNVYIKSSFEDVLAEPDGIHSFECLWMNSRTCYEGCKGCCYKLMTSLCGLCIAMYWGITFAYIAFYHIWFATPYLRGFSIFAGSCQKCIGTIANCCCAPICEACGICLSNIAMRKMS